MGRSGWQERVCSGNQQKLSRLLKIRDGSLRSSLAVASKLWHVPGVGERWNKVKNMKTHIYVYLLSSFKTFPFGEAVYQ
jgi:hypothetical protein